MRLSLSFTGFGSIAANLPAVKTADEVGLDGIWYAEHICAHDAIVPAAVYLQQTERLELAVMGLNAASRHPGLTAMELASLAEIAPGRVRAAIGTGAPDMIAKLGKTIEKPVKETLGLHRALRSALAGADLSAEFPGFSFAQYKLNPLASPPPLDIMAIRPRMVQAAARHADGVCLSAGGSREYLARTVRTVEEHLEREGRDRSAFRISAVVAAFVTADLDAARNQVAALLSTFDAATTEHLAAGLIPEGALVEAVARGGPFEAVKVFTPEVVESIALVCPPDGLGEALARYAATGVDEIAVAPFAPPDQLPALVRALAEARAVV